MIVDAFLRDPFLIGIPLFGTAIALEVLMARAGWIRSRYEVRDTATSLFLGVGSVAMFLIASGIGVAALQFTFLHRINTIHMSLTMWIVFFFLDDFTYYWSHRFSHRFRLWWAVHVNHHSSQHYNLSTAFRQPWTTELLGTTWLFWTWLCWIGFPVHVVVFQKGLNLVYQIWLHTEAIGVLPKPFEAVFNTPSHHRVHHACNPRYFNRNFGGVLIIWDRLFGTFAQERESEPCRYGIKDNLMTFSPLRVLFHEWMALARDVRGCRNLRDLKETLWPSRLRNGFQKSE